MKNSQSMFDSLVRNAIDFLNHSVSELEKTPKYSLVNFFAAIELFLKARLMLEHWALIDESPQNANQTNFLNGNFKSVGMDEAVRRLRNIANVKLLEKEFESFNQLREHRNKLIHFFHPNYVEPDTDTLRSVVAEQCKGWYYLHRLLTEKWRNEFVDYLEDIDNLHELMKKQQGYLQAKFNELQPSINKGKERGIKFSTCYYCGYEACRQEEVINNYLLVEKCLVCEERLRKLKSICPNPACNGDLLAFELAKGTCEQCGSTTNIEYLISHFAQGRQLAYCSECQYTTEPTVVPFDDKWLCLYCLTMKDRVNHCGWCGELVTGNTGDYYSPGCIMCAVHIQRDAETLEYKS